MHTLELTVVYLCIKFEMPGFTYSKVMMRAAKFTNGSRHSSDPAHGHIAVACYMEANT